MIDHALMSSGLSLGDWDAALLLVRHRDVKHGNILNVGLIRLAMRPEHIGLSFEYSILFELRDVKSSLQSYKNTI